MSARTEEPGWDLGPFRLHRPIGRGGLGCVWSALHRDHAVRVAVKVLASAPDEAKRLAFRDEVRAIASLDHPGIVRIFDHGEVSPEAALASGGRLTAGSPYFAMELASGGTLRDRPPADWPALRALLVAILDALAHAHARGFVHRDLKLSNLLVCTEEDARPGVKLSDFNLALAPDKEASDLDAMAVSGTPQYMAPEQFLGRWRDFGPWTDLYALGCLAFEMASGRPPIDAASLFDMAQRHLSGQREPFAPAMAVPKDFSGWLDRLIDPRPELRFERAADAFSALALLADVEDAPQAGAPAPPAPAWQATQTLEALRVHSPDRELGPSRAQVGIAARALPPVLQAPSRSAMALPEPPEDWRQPSVPEQPMRLEAVGLGLYGLRALPLVGREAERDALWAAFRAAREARQPRVVVLHGASGYGKSELARWLCERLHEVGAATPLTARHAELPGPGDGLPGMLRRALRCQALGASEVLERAGKAMRRLGSDDPEEAAALAAIVTPLGEPGAGGAHVRPGSDRERYSAVLHYLELLAARRPVVVWLDDVQWGPDVLGLVRYASQHQPPLDAPICFLLTARSEALAERPIEAQALQGVGGARIEIGPLDAASSRALVRMLLRLDGTVAQEIEERAAGNPLFAVQLVGDWVHRGLLVPGETGFKLARGVATLLPDDLHAIWAERVGRALGDRPPGDRRALELAAALGQHVDPEEWHAACAAAALDVPLRLVEDLTARQLVAPDHDAAGGWRFVHGMLRESIERGAALAGRREGHHATCAEMLERRSSPGQPADERVGRHMLAAGRLAEALPFLEAAAQARRDAGAYLEGLRLLEEAGEARKRLSLPPDDPQAGTASLLQAALLHLLGRIDEAHELCDRAIAQAESLPRLTDAWRAILARALVQRADHCFYRGDSAGARAALAAARRHVDKTGDPQLMADHAYSSGRFHLFDGRLEEAFELLTLARGLYAEQGSAHGRARSDCMLAAVHRQRGDLARAEACAQRACEYAELAGARAIRGTALVALGEVHRTAGRLDQAERAYERGLADHRRAGSLVNGWVTELNLALVALERRDPARALARLRPLRQTLERGGYPRQLASTLACLAWGAALARSWDAYDEPLRALSLLTQDSEAAHLDPAAHGERAGDAARDAGELARAAVAYRFARAQWAASGAAGEVERLQGKLGEVGVGEPGSP